MRYLPLSLLILSTTAAIAQNPGQAPTLEELNQLFFVQYDHDNDGQVTWDEFIAEPTAKFRYLDRNADGVVDMQEVAAFTRMMTEQAPTTRQ